jgi:hypothetical protein
VVAWLAQLLRRFRIHLMSQEDGCNSHTWILQPPNSGKIFIFHFKIKIILNLVFGYLFKNRKEFTFGGGGC